MGGCATKPKVLKDSNDPKGDAMAPAPSTSPRAPPHEVDDTVVTEAVVENDPPPLASGVDVDSTTKNSSLGSLFKENQEVKDPAETVKVSDVSEVTTKEVEKTIPEDSSLKKTEEMKTEEEAKEAGAEEVPREITDQNKPADKDKEVDVVTPEEKNLDHIETRVVDSDENKPQTPRQEQGNKDTDESPKPAVLHPPPPADDQENFATPKEKPVETYAEKDEKKPEADEVKQQTLNK